MMQGTRVYRDPFKGDHMLTSAFDQHNQLVQSLQCDALPKLEGPLWWLAADADGQLVLHATLSDPGKPLIATSACDKSCSVPAERLISPIAVI